MPVSVVAFIEWKAGPDWEYLAFKAQPPIFVYVVKSCKPKQRKLSI